jgi:HD-like signal output (HDOD) protein
MKTRVYFSGFAGQELPALQAETGKLEALWECSFVANPTSTRELLADRGCDALVVNMSAFGKEAVELLREAGRLRANPLRFIVGDVDNQSVVINHIGGSHHFIRRPVAPAELIKNIQRGLKLDVWLSTSELRALAPRLSRLPSLPSTYFNLLKEIESPAATLQGIAGVIARDPAATARLLQTVNSAAFSPAEKVTQPADAVALLGVQTVKSLVLSLQVFSQNDEARKAGLTLEILWEHSLLVAKFARLITLKQTGDIHLAEEAFTVGLLHDVGRIVLASNLPQEYAATVAAAREKSRPLEEEETAQFGVNHAKVGAYLLGLWGLPAEYIEATAAHHAPGQTAFAPEFSLLGAVHAANVFAHEMSGQTDSLLLPQLDLPYYQMLKLDSQLAIWRQACTGEPPPPPVEKPAAPPAAPSEPTVRALAPAAVRSRRQGPLWSGSVIGLGLVLAGLLIWFLWPQPNPSTVAKPMLAPAAPTGETLKPEGSHEEKALTPSQPVAPEPAVAKPRPNPLDTVRIQGVFYRRTNPQAIINNNLVAVGDSVAGVSVTAIGPSNVILSFEGKQRTYTVR